MSSAIIFRLFETLGGGMALYTETQPSVVVTNGSFNATIGTVTPLSLPFDVPYWLSIAGHADGEATPRQGAIV